MEAIRTIMRLLAVLAILGLSLAPVATYAAAAQMRATAQPADAISGHMGDAMASMPDDMPCCPQKAPPSDCSKGCPLATICLAKCFGAVAPGIVIQLPYAVPAELVGFDQFVPEPLPAPPLPKPPKS